MALINDLINELQKASVLESSRVAGGEDLLDIRSGASTLTDKTVAILQEKLAHETKQLALIGACIASLTELANHGYPTRKVFNVSAESAAELDLKQKQMREFSGELLPIVIGADLLIINQL